MEGVFLLQQYSLYPIRSKVLSFVSLLGQYEAFNTVSIMNAIKWDFDGKKTRKSMLSIFILVAFNNLLKKKKFIALF